MTTTQAHETTPTLTPDELATERARITAELPDADCGHRPEPSFYGPGAKWWTDGVMHETVGVEISTPGYGIDVKTNESKCYDCITREELATIEATTDHAARIYAYTNERYTKVVNWPGRELMKIESVGGSRTQTTVRARDAKGRLWLGVGPAESGTCIGLRLSKTEVSA